MYGALNLFWGGVESDEQRRLVLCERVKRTNLANAGVARALLVSHNLDQLLADREATLRLSYFERQQQSLEGAVIDSTR